MLGTPRSRRASRPATADSCLGAILVPPRDLEVIGRNARSPYYADARNCDGVTPTCRRNDAVKWLWLV